MTRQEALKLAQEQVRDMATNSRGFMDGAGFEQRVRAVETFARFLLGESDDE
jgi:hypothetical protein